MGSHTSLSDQLLVSLVYLMTFIAHSSKLHSFLWIQRPHSEKDVCFSWLIGTDFWLLCTNEDQSD